MNRTPLYASLALAFLAPGAALAQHFETVDTIPYPNSGRFPAYTAQETRPTDIYLRGGVQRDSNVFRLGSAADTQALLGTSSRSETITRAGVGIRHQQRIFGRQSIRLEGTLDHYAFDRYSLLNHNAYFGRGEWLWEVTNDLSGTMGFERRYRLVDLAQRQRAVKDMITEDHAFATAAYALGPSFRLRGGLDGAKAKHSDDTFTFSGGRVNTVTGGIDYVTPLGNAAGIEARRSQGNFPIQAVGPTAVLVDNQFTEKELAGVLTWTASQQLRATGRIGRTNRTHTQFPARNFSGTTGRAAIDWMPLPKTGFDFMIYKEPRTIVDIGASYVVVKGVSFGPRWAPTEKLVVTAALVNERQDFGGDPTVVIVPGTPQRQETVRAVRLGAGWEPVRMYQVSVGLDKGKRTSNALLRDYDYTAATLNLRVNF
jgi:exopolysaccharide biosynthesis operon protein EpsL